MLAEFFDRIVGLAKGAHKVDFHTHAELPDVVFIRHGEQLLDKAAPPPKRAHKLRGFDDLVHALKDRAIARAAEVYIGPNRVVALLDRAERRERVTLELELSQRWRLVTELARPRAMQPRDAVKMLRFDLHGGNVAHIIQALSRVDFTRSSSGRTDVAHGRESLGRSVEAVVQQADQVPDRFPLAVPIWTTPGFARYSANIEFGVYLDLEAQAVEIRVLADELPRVTNQVIAAAGADLREALGDEIPVFEGEP